MRKKYKRNKKTQKKILQEIINDLKSYQPEKIILFGSVAKGKFHSQSDFDLIVIKKTKAPFLQRLKKVNLLIKGNYPLDILVYTPKEFQEMLKDKSNSFFRSIKKSSKIIYEKPKV